MRNKLSKIVIPVLITFPADLAEANNRSRLTGNESLSRTEIISIPTAPVAPTIPIAAPPDSSSTKHDILCLLDLTKDITDPQNPQTCLGSIF